ncbi:Type I Iterative PKS [Penicillium waksmanii]|uniref:Type I Iterative PKS n=1 Tax=Penicillium waksmanii TaxID=69791 RepID=UPI0025498362|nr:Type I Iterative PKS [Penicillium waksmanii]KAJ5988465.1 Type I Iterative PKS [Penicillium waksmanii]
MTSVSSHCWQARNLSISLDFSVNKYAGHGRNRAIGSGEARSLTYFTAYIFCLLAPLSSESESSSQSLLPLDEALSSSVSGYCRGDAVATIILKRLADAEADHDNILGIIRSVAPNHSADAISITHPHGATQENLYRRVLSQAGVKSQDISYVEIHGTGTQAGDNREISSVTGVFASMGSRFNEQKLYVGSVKANVGHGPASSGVTALIKTLLMMRLQFNPTSFWYQKGIGRRVPCTCWRGGVFMLPRGQSPGSARRQKVEKYL